MRLKPKTLNFIMACIRERVEESIELDLKERFDAAQLIKDEVFECGLVEETTEHAIDQLAGRVSRFLSEEVRNG